MTLPNVNDLMTRLSDLQIVPPPKHHHGPEPLVPYGKEPSVPPLPPAYCPERRDDVPTTKNRSSSKHLRDDNRKSSQNGGLEISSATAPESSKGTTPQKRRQASQSRKRGEEISTPPPSNSTPNSDSSSKQKSIKKISDLITTNTTNKQYDNMIMVGTQRVYPRTLIQPTIYHNAATDLWIATIHTDASSVPTATDISINEPKVASTNQVKQKAFSFHDERAARASAYANSPPVLIPYGTTSQCMLCDISFTFLRRPKHCKNCGVIICADCCTRWNVKMLPETYANKSALGLSKTVRVCVSCDAVAKRFKNALMMGRYDMAVEGYLTGNVNLRCPFVFKGEEITFPIHCAILGQSERLLRWLVDVQCCPLHLTSTANKGKKSYEEDLLPTLQTSKGRSVMDIAMETKHVGILRYLVKEKGVSVHEVKDIALVLGALECMIVAFPEDIGDDSSEKENGKEAENVRSKKQNSQTNKQVKGCSDKIKSPKQSLRNSKSQREAAAVTKPQKLAAYSPKVKKLVPRDIHAMKPANLYGSVGRYDSDDDKNDAHVDSDDDCSVATTMNETCILCNEMPIDCVATPCGHQVCCLSCGKKRLACPSCMTVCQFIEIYQP